VIPVEAEREWGLAAVIHIADARIVVEQYHVRQLNLYVDNHGGEEAIALMVVADDAAG
jgi:hypothetical protein